MKSVQSWRWRAQLGYLTLSGNFAFYSDVIEGIGKLRNNREAYCSLIAIVGWSNSPSH